MCNGYGGEAWRGIRKILLAKTVRFGWEKQINSTVFAQTRSVLGWLETSQLASQLTHTAVCHSGLCAGDPFRFNVHPLHPALDKQLPTASVPQNTGQQTGPNFPKDIRRIGSPSTTMKCWSREMQKIPRTQSGLCL